MSPNIVLCLLCGVLVGTGMVLLLARSLVRSLFGVLLMGNGVNLMFLVASGRPGRAPLVSKDNLDPPIGPGGISDPLPQAMVLTAIVITLAVTAFTLALAHRSWQLQASDEVADDEEGVRTHDAAVHNDLSDSDYLDPSDPHALPEDAKGSSHPETDPKTDSEPNADEADDPSRRGEESGSATSEHDRARGRDEHIVSAEQADARHPGVGAVDPGAGEPGAGEPGAGEPGDEQGRGER